MKNIFIILLAVVLYTSCDKIPVGYLNTDYARFSVDTVLVKLNPDTRGLHMGMIDNPEYLQYLSWGFTPADLEGWCEPKIPGLTYGEDYERAQQNIPWVSYQMEGIDGTNPLFYKVVGATKVGGGDFTELLSKCRARGDGAVEVDFENNIEEGRYMLDIEVSNEGHAKVLKNVLTVVVK